MEALRYYCKNREGSQCGKNLAVIASDAVRIAAHHFLAAFNPQSLPLRHCQNFLDNITISNAIGLPIIADMACAYDPSGLFMNQKQLQICHRPLFL